MVGYQVKNIHYLLYGEATYLRSSLMTLSKQSKMSRRMIADLYITTLHSYDFEPVI